MYFKDLSQVPRVVTPDRFAQFDCRTIQPFQFKALSPLLEIHPHSVRFAESNTKLTMSILSNLSFIQSKRKIYLFLESPICTYKLDFALLMHKRQPEGPEGQLHNITIVEDRFEMIKLCQQDYFFNGIEISGDSYKLSDKTNFLAKTRRKQVLDDAGFPFDHIQLNRHNMRNVEQRIIEIIGRFEKLQLDAE